MITSNHYFSSPLCSKGRTGHIPYRDSKLTRILQPFLGGNGRTAIICTMSPARSHIEQSRNTLSFASCAKQVVTNAQVNAVMSDKALVRHLQRELTRLENEQRYRESETCTDQSDVLKDKDAQIQKVSNYMRFYFTFLFPEHAQFMSHNSVTILLAALTG